jgi:hypothetical protein
MVPMTKHDQVVHRHLRVGEQGDKERGERAPSPASPDLSAGNLAANTTNNAVLTTTRGHRL